MESQSYVDGTLDDWMLSDQPYVKTIANTKSTEDGYVDWNILDLTAPSSATQLNQKYGLANSSNTEPALVSESTVVNNNTDDILSQGNVCKFALDADVPVTNPKNIKHELSSRAKMLMRSNTLFNTIQSNKTALKTLCRYVIAFHPYG